VSAEAGAGPSQSSETRHPTTVRLDTRDTSMTVTSEVAAISGSARESLAGVPFDRRNGTQVRSMP
jgi:hypothetical protein